MSGFDFDVNLKKNLALSSDYFWISGCNFRSLDRIFLTVTCSKNIKYSTNFGDVFHTKPGKKETKDKTKDATHVVCFWWRQDPLWTAGQWSEQRPRQWRSSRGAPGTSTPPCNNTQHLAPNMYDLVGGRASALRLQ